MKLKPCPFCGTFPHIVFKKFKDPVAILYRGEYIVECDYHYCPCQPTAHDTYLTKEEAVKGWNTRCDCAPNYMYTERLTCHVMSKWPDDDTSMFITELSCGHEMYGFKDEFDFCGKCGARMVR